MTAPKIISLETLVKEETAEVSELLSNKENYSIFESYEQFQLLILRRMALAEESLTFSVEVFIVKKEKIYCRSKEDGQFSLLPHGVKGLLDRITHFYDENKRIITAYSHQIERLEGLLFNRKLPSYFMDLWFDIKKDLSKMESFYYRNGMVYKEFSKRTTLSFGDYIDEFKDIEEGIQLQASSIQRFKGRLDSLYSYHDSIKGERLNKTLLLLTIISGIFLPLNLIVGFFGMNTSELFFTQEPEGTLKVIYLLTAVLVLCLLGMRILKTLDHYFFRVLLGRYNFYKDLTQRIEGIEKSLKGK